MYKPVKENIVNALFSGFGELSPSSLSGDSKEFESVLNSVVERLHDNYPYFHPMYAGQMLKPPHPVARLAYALAMHINPNNHALDGGRASSAMEKEAVVGIAEMFGWKTHLGHLTGGGTMANLEALWVSSQIHPGKIIVASEQSHYTHSRISGVLGLKFESIATDERGRMDLNSLEKRLQRGDVGTVVATIGTTSTGSVDRLDEIMKLRERHGFRIHADAAYGGYFRLADNLASDAAKAYLCLEKVDSLVIDPHKHGLQPYGCGCVIFADPSVGKLYKHESPYTYFSSKDLHLGEISLECSRPGAAAVALWATMKKFPLVKGGEFANGLMNGRKAALKMFDKLNADNRFVVAFPPELDIVVWAVRATSVTEASIRAKRLFAEAEKKHLYLALAELPVQFFDFESPGMNVDAPRVTSLRSVLMKPEHLEWVDRIWNVIDQIC